MDPIIERALSLFTPAEWRTFIWLVVSTLGVTHLLKGLWRLCPVKGGGSKGVQLISLLSGFVAAYMMWPAGTIPWYVAGLIAGPAANILFKVAFATLTKLAPDVAGAINFDRRKENLGAPPEDVGPRRKEDAKP